MNSLAQRRVLVTGAGGFIGGHLTERLVTDGAEVRALVRYNSRDQHGALDALDPQVKSAIDVRAGDIRDLESVRDAVSGVEIVLNLAAQIAIPYSYINPRDFFETNVLGGLNVAQAALAEGVERVVQTSTSEVYGTAQTVPITEDHPLEAQSPYAASKIASDKLMDSFNRSHGLGVVVLRPFNTFGPGQSARAVIPTIISQALAGGRVRIGSLDPRRDMTYVADTAAGFVAAATADGVDGRTIQLGTGYDVSIGDILAMIGELLGRELEVETDASRIRPARSEVLRLISSPALAGELLGWKPEVELREGLARTIAWMEQNQGLFRTDRYVV